MTNELESINQLTRAQLECLVLVNQHMTSKEIGPLLGVSSHTVDQRIRAALKTLGCSNRLQAARLIASSPQSRGLFQWETGAADRDVDRGPEPRFELGPEPQQKAQRKRPQFPFATADFPRNEFSIAMRLFWIFIIACGAAFSMGVYLAGLESFARLVHGFDQA